jgi:hypothetical protein
MTNLLVFVLRIELIVVLEWRGYANLAHLVRGSPRQRSRFALFLLRRRRFESRCSIISLASLVLNARLRVFDMTFEGSAVLLSGDFD